MQKPLSEKFVKQSIIKWLFRKGWGRNLEVGELRDRGVDIRVRHNNYARYFLIETKGEGKIRQADEVAGKILLWFRFTRSKRKNRNSPSSLASCQKTFTLYFFRR